MTTKSVWQIIKPYLHLRTHENWIWLLLIFALFIPFVGQVAVIIGYGLVLMVVAIKYIRRTHEI